MRVWGWIGIHRYSLDEVDASMMVSKIAASLTIEVQLIIFQLRFAVLRIAYC